MNQFKFYVPINDGVYPDIVKGFMKIHEDGSTEFVNDVNGERYFKEQSGNITKDFYIEGIASTQDIDRDDEVMSEKAMHKMKTDILSHKVNIFGNHEHDWENSLGRIVDAELKDGNKRLWIKFLCDDPETNPKIPMLINKLKRKIGLGFSIGGKVLELTPKFMNNKEVGMIDDLELYEISVVGIPSNKFCDMSISEQIFKSSRKLINKVACSVCKSTIKSKECSDCGAEFKKSCLTCGSNKAKVICSICGA